LPNLARDPNPDRLQHLIFKILTILLSPDIVDWLIS
jgi:hypothetical protein